MNTNKDSYTILYAIGMVVVVALLLAFVSGALKERQTTNINLDKKKQILSSINIDTKGKDAEKLYEQYITKAIVVNAKGETISDSKDEAFAIDMKVELSKPLEERLIPVYIASVDSKTKYIFTLQGVGLWGAIWGYVSLNDDKNSIYGTYFSHASETPGLGAEIATKNFQERFIGKKVMNSENNFASIAIVKPGKTDDTKDYVDGISGGTITSKGVEKMIMNSLGQYENFLKIQKKGEENNE